LGHIKLWEQLGGSEYRWRRPEGMRAKCADRWRELEGRAVRHGRLRVPVQFAAHGRLENGVAFGAREQVHSSELGGFQAREKIYGIRVRGGARTRWLGGRRICGGVRGFCVRTAKGHATDVDCAGAMRVYGRRAFLPERLESDFCATFLRGSSNAV